MATLDIDQVRAGIEWQLKQVSAINRVYKYGQVEQPISDTPTAEIILENVARRPMGAAQRMFGHNDYELTWSVMLAVDLGQGYTEAQEQMDALISDVRNQFDQNAQFADPVSGTTVDDSALSNLRITLMRKDTAGICLCATGTLETLVSVLASS